MRKNISIVIIAFIALFWNGVFPLCAVSEPKNLQESAGIIAYKKFTINILRNLGKQEKIECCDKILAARDEFLRHRTAMSEKDAKESFLYFLDVYDCIVGGGFVSSKYLEDLLNGVDINSVKNEEERKKYKDALKELSKFRSCGIGFDRIWQENSYDWIYDRDPDFLIQVLTDFGVKGRLKKYLTFIFNEEKEKLTVNDKLNISWDDFRKKIIRWEKFLSENPSLTDVLKMEGLNSELIETNSEREKMIPADLMLEGMIHIYLMGTDSKENMAYDYSGTGKINAELKKSYETFIKDNRSSSYYNLINGVYSILGKHDFVVNQELITFVKANNKGDLGWSILEDGLKIFEKKKGK